MSKLAWISCATLLLVAGASDISRAQTVQDAPPLQAYAWPLAALVEQTGPMTPPANWWLRQTIGDALDYIGTPPTVIENHPLVHAEYGPFLSLYHRASIWYMIDHMVNAPPTFPGVMFHHGYSSSWIAQMPGFKIMVDFCDGPFAPNVISQGLYPLEQEQLDLIAANVDAYFVSHLHSDHLSSYLVYRMLQLGKPVYAPLDLAVQAYLSGIPNAQNIIVPMQGIVYQVGPIQFQVFQGYQYGGFLDPSSLVGDPTNPFNVMNNAYIFSMNGVTFAHFGDNNDSNIVPWAAGLSAQPGWSPQFTMNLGLWGDAVSSFWNQSVRALSHEHEYHHLGPQFVQRQVGTSLNLNRLVLFWGEMFHFVPSSTMP